MTPERWQQVKLVYNEVMELNPEDRPEYLDRACGEDSGLREQVERLLAQNTRTWVPLPLPFHPAGVSRPIPDSRVTWAEGEIISERFKILRFLGRGGMGEVYEAEERPSGERVALKTIRTELAGHAGLRERFRTEVNLSRKVTHLNVCRIHGLFESQAPPENGTAGTIPYLSMELLSGRTLKQHLSKKPLTRHEALPLARQMAAAVDAAHREGVVHRDLKSSNVMLVRDRAGHLQVKVMDFGLACAVPDGSRGVVGDAPGGTPDFMAPEQLLGGEVGPACDIYALGVVLFEMITGQLPFPHASTMGEARISRESPARSPRDLVPDLDRAWESSILQCLDRDPAKRPPSAGALVRAIESDPWIWLKRAIVIALVAIVLRGAAIVGGIDREPVPVVVADFENRTSEQALDLAARELLTVALGQSRSVHVIPRSQVQETLPLMRLSRTAPFDHATAIQMSRREGWPVVISGSVAAQGGGYEVTVRLTDPRAELARSVLRQPLNHKNEMVAVMEDLAGRVRRSLGENWISMMRPAQPLERVTTSSFEALERFSRAMEARNRAGMEEALRWLEAAVEVDGEFAMAHRQLSTVAGSLGRFERSLAAAVRAYELRERSSERERHHIDALYHAQFGDFRKVMDAYRTLTVLYPRDSSAHSQLAQYLAFLGRMDGAVATMRKAVDLSPNNVVIRGLLAVLMTEANQEDGALEEIRQARERGFKDTYLNWGEGLAWLGKGETERARRAFQLLAQGGGVYEGWGRFYEAQALILEGKLSAAILLLESSEPVHFATSNADTETRSRDLLGRLYLLTGDRTRALAQAGLLAMPEASPAQRSLKGLRKQALLYSELGVAALAEPVALEMKRLAAQHPNMLMDGLAFHLQGVLDQSASRWDEARDNLERARQRWNDVLTLWSLAEYWDARRDCARALPLYEEIVARKGSVFRTEFSGLWVLAHLKAGRCHRNLGAYRNAAGSYDIFLRHWRSSGLALVHEANQERQSLVALGY